MGLVQGISDAFTRAVPKVPVNTVSELTPVGVVSNQTNGTIATATGIKTTTNVVTETISDASEELTKSGIVRITDGAQKFNCTNCGIALEEVTVKAAKGGVNAYEIGLAGGKHSGFLKNYLGRSTDEIAKSIKSMQTGNQGISIHLDKIANPTKYVPNWNSLRASHQQSLINGWQNTVSKHTQQIQILEALLEK